MRRRTLPITLPSGEVIEFRYTLRGRVHERQSIQFWPRWPIRSDRWPPRNRTEMRAISEAIWRDIDREDGTNGATVESDPE
jgi:hypothetical protein